ncbi:prolyl oligopeptidase family serine peptidase [Chryseobacterium sp.]|uniref:S9 family peptidase n=1 Tax=Chryseobacterium sp. TaxID=1871047 RepID=UPI0012A8C17E|nr:prolyl oligopeptidase family serine peptidase [Chryseobacterium sp.]QFG53451.1 S9 family peptidase [Chryseobacterium sp.]
MKQTILKLLLLLLFLLSALHAAQEMREASLSRLIKTTEDIDFLTASDSGRWVTWRKIYDRKNDTLRIQSAANRTRYFNRLQILRHGFFRQDEIWLISKDGNGEWLNMKTGKSVGFTGVAAMEYLPASGLLLIQHDKKRRGALILMDAGGRTVRKMEHTVACTAGPSGTVFAAVEREDGKTAVISITAQGSRELLVVPEKVTVLKPEEDGKRLLVFLSGHTGKDLAAVNLQSGRVARLSDPAGPVRSVATLGSPFGSIYSLELLWPEKQQLTSGPDIWYGSDRDLIKKFYPDHQLPNVIWDAEEGKILKEITGGYGRTANLRSDRYFLNYNPTELQDYTQGQPPLKLYRYDAVTGQRAVLDTVRQQLYSDPEGKWLLSPVLNTPVYNELREIPETPWNLYRLADGSKTLLDRSGMQTPYFTGRGDILFDGIGGLRTVDPANGKVTVLAPFPGSNVKLLNGKSTALLSGNLLQVTEAPADRPLLLEVTQQESGSVMYCLWQRGVTTVIIPFTKDLIRKFSGDSQLRRFTWIRENYNRVPEVQTAVAGRKPVTLYKSNVGRPEAAEVRMEYTAYKGPDGKFLRGILYYPARYDKSRKYPVVVHIYEKQSQNANRFLKPSMKQSLGFNIRNLLEKGYFVYLPDISYGDDGPGLSALQCVNAAMDELVKNPAVDEVRIALVGQSFGGYETNFIAGHSKRFAAFISGTAHIDIVHDYHSFNYNYFKPDFWRYETYQYRMSVPFAKDRQKYFDNNPLYNADRVSAPVLLWTGLEDQNVDWQETRTFYNALRRNDKKVIALFYKNNGHGMIDEKSQTDLSRRLLDWLDYFLKDVPIDWIGKEMKKDAKF